MSLQLGQIAPDFEQDRTEGQIRFHGVVGKRLGSLLQSSQGFYAGLHDGTCRGRTLEAEWDKRGVKPIGLSVDPVESHLE